MTNPFYFAHSANRCGEWHRTAEHLGAVASMAKAFLEPSEYATEAELAGFLHDLGKYGDLFQQRLRNPKQITGLDHWSCGAWVALRKHQALAAAFAIQGHHLGLRSWQELEQHAAKAIPKQLPLNLRLSEPAPDILLTRLKADGIDIPKTGCPMFNQVPEGIGDMLEIRRLFSALTDADFIDTEAHFQGDKRGKIYRQRGPELDAERALQLLLEHICVLTRNSDAPAHVNSVRQDLLAACQKSADLPLDLFTLTAPTGSGKTLAMLAFALKHAARHRLKRIILVIPYLSIIEQTADIYRSLFSAHDFGEHYILEHHSLAGLGPESVEDDAEGANEAERQRCLLAQNWDAPIVLTTSVQLLESLFSNRPSTCRKLHRMAGSVILFDEVQTLPVKLAVPTLAALSHLSEEWGSSVVFSTATQPAFEHLNEAVKKQGVPGWNPREIVQQSQTMTDRLRRVRYHWPSQGEVRDWASVAGEIAAVTQGLCIVNLKKDARAVWEILAENGTEGVYHLSTNLCPLHRKAVLKEVRRRLASGEPCRLIATQCIEAGVDVDFPAVWRAIGPLDAIIQAAGRCNREGKQHAGDVRVFIPEHEPFPPMPGYKQATKVMLELLRRVGVDKFDPYDGELIGHYYRTLYDLCDPDFQSGELLQSIREIDFPEVARRYRLIDQDSINIIVPYSEQLLCYEELSEWADSKGLSAGWIRKTRGITVSIYRPRGDAPVWNAIKPVRYFRSGSLTQDEWFIYLRSEDYHEHLGLVLPEQLHLLIA